MICVYLTSNICVYVCVMLSEDVGAALEWFPDMFHLNMSHAVEIICYRDGNTEDG